MFCTSLLTSIVRFSLLPRGAHANTGAWICPNIFVHIQLITGVQTHQSDKNWFGDLCMTTFLLPSVIFDSAQDVTLVFGAFTVHNPDHETYPQNRSDSLCLCQRYILNIALHTLVLHILIFYRYLKYHGYVASLLRIDPRPA